MQRERIVELERIGCNVVLEQNDVELERHGCNDVVLVPIERSDVVLVPIGRSDVVLEQSNVVVLGLVDCIQDRLVLSVCIDVLVELGGGQLEQPYNEELVLLCSVHLSHEYRIFQHESVDWKQSYRSGKLYRHYYVQRFRVCVDKLVLGDVHRQLEHMK